MIKSWHQSSVPEACKGHTIGSVLEPCWQKASHLWCMLLAHTWLYTLAKPKYLLLATSTILFLTVWPRNGRPAMKRAAMQAARVRSHQINSTGTKIFQVMPLSGVVAPYSRATLTAAFKPVAAGRKKGFKATAPPSDEAFTYACHLTFDGWVILPALLCPSACFQPIPWHV